jgi:hypothetical protein
VKRSRLMSYLRILDICSIVLEIERKHVCDIQSLIRRISAGVEFNVEGEKYLASRKNMKKRIQKALRNLKGIKNQ